MSSPDSSALPSNLLRTPLHDLHVSLNARMVPFAGYSMPVQYPSGLMAEHHHTRTAAGLFDVSHMGQLRLVGPDAAAALETLMPVDVIDLPVGKQRYGLLLNDEGGIIDDLMFVQCGGDSFPPGRIRDSATSSGGRKPHEMGDGGGNIFVIVNGACKVEDMAHIRAKIGTHCQVISMPERALLALQGPQAVTALARLVPGVETLVFMTGGSFTWNGTDLFLTRSGYTGEDGFEISIHNDHAEAFARALLAQPEVKPIGLGARNSLRLEAGLCLYGNDIDAGTTPVEAGLNWAMQKVRRAGGGRAGGFPGAIKILAQLAESTGTSGTSSFKKRVGLVALERIPVRDHTELQNLAGVKIGEVTSGLLGPTIATPIAMGYVDGAHAALGLRINAIVRGKPVPMEVCAMPFVATHYFRG